MFKDAFTRFTMLCINGDLIRQANGLIRQVTLRNVYSYIYVYTHTCYNIIYNKYCTIVYISQCSAIMLDMYVYYLLIKMILGMTNKQNVYVTYDQG